MEDLQLVPEIMPGDRVAVIVCGIRFGNCALSQLCPHYQDPINNVNRIARALGEPTLLMPDPDFTHDLVQLEDLNKCALYGNYIKRPLKKADGAIIERRGVAAAIANADCPTGLLYDPAGSWVAVLHLGLKCLLPRGDSRNILQAAVRASGRPPAELALWVGAGIGPCCFGYDQKDYAGSRLLTLTSQSFPAIFDWSARVEKGPRTGQVAIDLFALIQEVTAELGIGYVKINKTCSACAKYKSNGHERMYFSNTYGDRRKRNLVIGVLL